MDAPKSHFERVHRKIVNVSPGMSHNHVTNKILTIDCIWTLFKYDRHSSILNIPVMTNNKTLKIDRAVITQCDHRMALNIHPCHDDIHKHQLVIKYRYVNLKKKFVCVFKQSLGNLNTHTAYTCMVDL